MGATKTIVSPAIAFVGMRVCRGRDFEHGWKSQDIINGKEVPGTIKDLPRSMGGTFTDGWVSVEWDGGGNFGYPIGSRDRYALYVWEDNSASTSSGTIITTSIGGGYIDLHERVNPGDEVIYARVISDSEQGGLAYGNKYKAGIEDGQYITIEGSSPRGWYFSKGCFVRAAKIALSAPKETYFTTTDGIADWDILYYVRHHKGSEYAYIPLNTWEQVIEIHSSKEFVRTLNSGEHWIHIGAFNAKTRGFTPTTLVGKTVLPGDEVRFARHISDSKGSMLSLGEWAIVKTADSTHLTTNSRPGWHVSRKCFDAVRKAVSKVEEVRKAMDTAPMSGICIGSGGCANWGSRLPKVGERVIYIKREYWGENQGMKVGDVVTVTEVSDGGSIRCGIGQDYWISNSCFLPENLGRDFIRKDTTKLSPISSSIKTKKDVRTTPKAIVRLSRTSGDAIKIQRTSPKISRQKEGGGSRVSVRASKARIGR